MRLIPMLVLFSLLASPQIARSAEPTPMPLAKVGPWEMNYDTDSCHLLAAFGTGDQAVSMRITRLAPGSSFDLTLYGNRVGTSDLRVDASIGFGDRPAEIKRTALSGTIGSERKLPMLIITSLRIDGNIGFTKGSSPIPEVTPAEEAATTSITVKLPSRKQFRFETGSLAVPFKALRNCTADLVKSWGFDPEVEARLIKRPETTGRPENWLTSNDFPRGPNQRGQSGALTFRLDVQETGRVSGCRVLFRTDPDDFADLTCKLLMKRAAMSPALDEHGKPVKSFYIRKVQWLAAP
ncbi:MAG: hypothetical protein B7Y98_12050 [Sphingomonas sp. 32-62-10]|nr:MAG: hypothetical protein B7Y98_12050 [Sphingomonas sp. 32-62-10]